MGLCLQETSSHQIHSLLYSAKNAKIKGTLLKKKFSFSKIKLNTNTLSGGIILRIY